MSWLLSSAGHRTEAALPRFQLRDAHEELRAAGLAVDEPGALATAIAIRDEDVFFFDQPPIALASAVSVAVVAAGDDVLRGVVVNVKVEMVSQDGVRHQSFAWSPSQSGGAPMTGVFARANLGVQDDSALGDKPRLGGKRMVRRSFQTLLLRTFNPVSAWARSVVAGKGTKAVRFTGPRCYGGSAQFACVGHPEIIPSRQEVE